MSSNVVSQFLVSDGKQVPAEHPSNSRTLPLSEPKMSMSIDPLKDFGSQNFLLSKEDPVLNNPGFKTSMIMRNQVGHNEVPPSLVPNPIWISGQLDHGNSVLQNNLAAGKTFIPVKRKAEVGASVKDSMQPSKRPPYTGAYAGSIGFLQPSAPQRRVAAAQNKLSAPNFISQTLMDKKSVGNNPLSDKNCSGSVRSKMKESLSAALALVKQQIMNKQEQTDAATGNGVPVPSDSAVGAFDSVSSEVIFSKDSNVGGHGNDFKLPSSELPLNDCNGNGSQTFHEFQYSSMLPEEDITFSDSFFVKDDLLQGNGLSWAFDLDAQMREGTEAKNPEKLKHDQEAQIIKNRVYLDISTPENVASEIEAELFKLFGGVNKKYKEKGRSLLFNLKDRSNPELRERVLSGDISPSRLCSMSAEELASKELSQWRMAKAEELAQMVVLPDTEVDIRRLVRKTHKGEYQVEVEHDEGTFAEVSGGTSMITQPHIKKKSKSVITSKEKENVAGQKDSSENQELSGSLVIQTDGTDLMQGMMGDELRDAEFLPPIVSLDEFMESLNSEPPFESLVADAEQNLPSFNKENPEAVDFQVLDQDSVPAKDASSRKADVVKRMEPVPTKKLDASPIKNKVLPSITGVEYLWQGMLQLNASASITVGCVFRSGEKTSSIKEWPVALNIMGRVKLDSFEKFLRELPMSRTRAVMVLEFDLKDKLSETERSHLTEAVDSYASDERLGYAEPTTGVELYLCPPTSRMVDMLNVLMPKEPSDSHNSMDNKLIGVVVWRRPQLSNARSPNASSHSKHGLKKQSLSAKPVQDMSNSKVNTPISVARIVSEPETDEIDDIPPGFGPMTAFRSIKDDDDLPEFNFSGHLPPSLPKKFPENSSSHGLNPAHRPVNQIRELIQKYGKSETSAATDSITNLGVKQAYYDDDDIPEWQPEAPNQLLQPHYPAMVSHLPTVHAPSASHQLAPVTSHQLPSGFALRPLGGRWMPSPDQRPDQRWK